MAPADSSRLETSAAVGAEPRVATRELANAEDTASGVEEQTAAT